MIISRTPFRMSFFGGGTDYPAWYDQEKGAVLVSTIDKYCYITCRWLPPFFEHRFRVVYSEIENTQDVDSIRHNSIREVLRFVGITDGVEIHHDGDVPARAGLGTSSSFTVGLLNSLYALQGRMTDKMQLAREAIHVEQDLIGENVGSQDQTAAAFGGLNRIEFSAGHQLGVRPMTISGPQTQNLADHLMLFFTGFSRTASDIAGEQIRNTPYRRRQLEAIYGMVDEAVGILSSDGDIRDFGRLLHEGWQVKRELSSKVSTDAIDTIYAAARTAGALGGKLLGAGGGGFFLLFVEPERQPDVHRALESLLHVPFRFESSGSQIIFFQPNTDVCQPE